MASALSRFVTVRGRNPPCSWLSRAFAAPARSTSTSTSAPPPAPAAQHTQPDPTTLFLDADQTIHYALHRPHYPQQLYDTLYANILPNRQPPFTDCTVVDIATGSGQALGPLPSDFGACVALDVSPAQLQELPQHLRARVRVQLGDAHATGLQAGVADLVTVGQALHWFRLDDFYTECRRILKPTGALAAWTYGFGTLDGFPGSQDLYEQLHSGTLGPHWAAGRKLVDNDYLGIEPGPQHFGEVRRLRVPMPSSPSLEALVGQILSWSAYRSYLQSHPGAPDPAAVFQSECAARMAVSGVDRLTLNRTVVLLLALQPRPVQDESSHMT